MNPSYSSEFPINDQSRFTLIRERNVYRGNAFYREGDESGVLEMIETKSLPLPSRRRGRPRRSYV